MSGEHQSSTVSPRTTLRAGNVICSSPYRWDDAAPARRDDRGPALGRQRPLIPQIRGGHPLPAHLQGAVVALGNFDGVHLGHQAVVHHAIEMARDRGVAAVVATFNPHPADHFNTSACPFALTTLQQRRRLLGMAGVDAMMIFKFDAALASVTPQTFVQHWLAGAGAVVTGSAFSFGRGRAGDVRTLTDLGARHGLGCGTVGQVTWDGEVVSSSRIRQALRQGDCTTATRMLTRPFAIDGILRNRGAAAASACDPDLTLDLGTYLRPKDGIYDVRIRLAGGPVLCARGRLDGHAALQVQSRDNDVLAQAGLAPARHVTVEFVTRLGD
jgi:riboflavin kinase/FMN adenylyltransferase